MGGGFARMKKALDENNNPPYEVNATNFFSIRFYKRVQQAGNVQLNVRQTILCNLMKERGTITKNEAAMAVNVSGDTVLRELNALIDLGLVERHGLGKTTTYSLKKEK